MPPKKNTGEVKAEQKKKEKVAEDKTFGLKNKNKSKAVQKYIATVTQHVKNPQGQRPIDELAARSEKKKEQERVKMLQSMFGSMGILETKKKKKKPEEDTGKIDLYVDQRAQQGTGPAGEGGVDDMADWDQDKLEKVVGQRHGVQQRQCQTDIICKFFLDAVEKNLYGWFWVCPNGGDTCKYRHALPPGYILKKSVASLDDDDEEEEMSLEEKIEIERAALPAGGTPVTEESFKQWLIKRASMKREAEEKEKQDIIDAAAKKGQKVPFGLTGRDLFAFDPTLFVDDEAAADEQLYGDLEDPNMVFDEELFGEENLVSDDDELQDEDDSENEESDQEEEENKEHEESDQQEANNPHNVSPQIVTTDQ